ncbi:hypothetical protein QTO30_04710 [Yoonia sp. GPGPB17]|uniref:hypothetical protein n=1 Tax=Yoonia sp. GPGPB17 TaxID=3026147 RepID=UPI0030C2582E
MNNEQDNKRFIDTFEDSLSNIERRFKRTRKGAHVQLGVTFIAIGIILAFVVPIFIPDSWGLTRRTTEASVDRLFFFVGMCVSAMGAYVIWEIRNLK